MSDVTPDAAAGAAPADAAAVPTGLAAMAAGEGGDAASPAQAASPDPAASQSAPQSNGSAESAWDILKDPVAKAWVTNKGLPDVPALAKSAMNAEKMLGRSPDDILDIPKDRSPEAMRPIWEKLGAGQSPEDYQLPIPEGQDDSFAREAQKWFHEAGVPVEMAQQLAEKWNEYAGGVISQQGEATKTRDEAQMAQLKLEWGQNYDPNMAIAMRAAEEFGIDAPLQDAMMQAVGPGQAARILLNIGSKLASDDGFVGGDTMGTPIGGSPEQARAQIRDLQRDRDFAQRWARGDSDARARMDRLHKIAYPGQ